MKFILVVILFLSSFSVFSQVTKQKSLSELQNDLSKIEKAITATRDKLNEVKDARFLPDLYFMLAEFHVEKGKYMYLIKQLENPDTPLNELDFTAERRPKQQAIEIYNQILEKFPNIDERDKALFFIAHEQRELGEIENMVKSYRRLTSEFPSSKFWEEAMLMVGNYSFETMKDFEGAIGYYQKIISRPQSPFHPIAFYKIGWCYLNLEKFKDSLLSFEAVLKNYRNLDLSSLPPSYKKTDVRRDALIALVRPYSEIEVKNLVKFGSERVNAVRYFYDLSPDLISYRKVLSRLARRMTVKARYIASTRSYFELLRISQDIEERVESINKLYEALQNTQKRWPLVGFSREIAKTIPQVKATKLFDEKEKNAIFKNFELYSRDNATRVHERAKKTKSSNDFQIAIESYESYLEAFPDTKYRYAIRLNLAESYFHIKDYIEAGKNYEFVASRYQKNPKRYKVFLDSALQSYIEALKNPAVLSLVELEQARYGFRYNARVYLKKYPKAKANENLRFLIGRTYYDERSFDRAVRYLFYYLKYHPNNKNTETAANLILDAYNQREDYDRLIVAGNKIAKNKKIPAKIRNEVSSIVQQAAFKRAQVEAGDFSSPEYAKKLLSFAQKFKGTNLGDKALFEAFTAYKSKKDPRAYQAGEQLLLKHSDSKYAKVVVTEMGKMALFTADFRRAAKYFEFFAKKYPLDKEAKSLMNTAATLRENLGDFIEAKKDFQFLNKNQEIPRMDFLGQNWSSLVNSASYATGIQKSFWKGLAHHRLNQKSQSRALLQQASKQSRGDFESKTMAAHALYLLAADALQEYKKIQMISGNEQVAVQKKDATLKKLTQQLNRVINFGNGKWTIAALYGLGQSNIEFGNFIRRAPLPKGLSSDQKKQYRQAIASQAKEYEKVAYDYFKKCINTAEKFEVFTQFTKGCLSKGRIEVDELQDAVKLPKASDFSPQKAVSLRRDLFDDPRNTQLLVELSQAYTQARDYSTANTILERAMEIDSRSSKYLAIQGVNYLFINDLETAYSKFKQAIKINQKDAIALYGIAALYSEFKFSAKAKRAIASAKIYKKPNIKLHPWMSRL